MINPEFKKIAFILKNDKNKNVNVFFQSIDLQDEKSIFINTDKNSNDLFKNDMEFLKNEFGVLNNIEYFYRPIK